MMRALSALLLCVLLLPGCHAQQDLSLYAQLSATDSIGRKQGIWVEHYESGAVKSVRYYKAGALDGMSMSFTERGELQTYSAYDGGKRHGASRAVEPSDGTVRVSMYDQGVVQLVQVFDRKGILQLEEFYQNGEIMKSVHHTPTGIIEGHPVRTP